MKQTYVEICEDAAAERLAIRHYESRAALKHSSNGIAVHTTNKRKGDAEPVLVDETMSAGQDIRILVFVEG